MERILRDKKAIFVFLFPALLIYGIIVLMPMVRSTFFTFSDGIYGVNWTFVGFDNYKKLWSDPQFWSSLDVTARYMVVTVIGQVGLGFIMAMLFTYMVPKIGVYGRAILFFPMVLPTVAVSTLFSKLLEMQPQPGLINQLLAAVGLSALQRAWTSDLTYALYTICAADIWRGIGFYCVVFYSGLVNISSDVIEAARIDGAKTRQVIRHVVLPLLRPVTITAFLICINWAIKVFDMPYTLTGGGPGRLTYAISLYMYDTAFRLQSYGYGSVLAIVMLVVALIIAGVLNLGNKAADE